VTQSDLRDAGNATDSNRLNSWKEIARYFNRDVRTVRRWESELGLPVHRRQHLRRGIVFAYQSELDAWWRAGRMRPERPARAAPGWVFVLAASIMGVALLASAFLAWVRPRTAEGSLPFEVVKTTTLTSNGRTAKAAISPNGRYIAYSLVTSGQQALHVRRMTEMVDTELVHPAPVRYVGITFTPDSERLYYITEDTGGGDTALYRIPVKGGAAQHVKDHLDSPGTFSPDGKRFAFVREIAGESVLMVADVDSGDESRLAARRLPQVLDYPAWSPDGQVIACTSVDSKFSSPRGSDARIIGVGVANGDERQLSSRTWPFIRELVWLDAGRGLALSARDQETGLFHVWHVSYRGGGARKITDGLNSQAGVSATTDSRQLLTVEQRTLFGIWRLRSAETGDPEPVSSESANCTSPLWTADGRIVFEQQLNSQRHLWIMAGDGSHRKQLTTAGSNYDASVSGDGRMLAYTSDSNGKPSIWTMDIDGGHPRMVINTDAEPNAQLSPDGKWIAFTAIGAKNWPTLRRVPAAGGPDVKVSDRMWSHPSISPDGKWIAGFYANHPSGTQNFPDSIAVIDSHGGPIRIVMTMGPSVLTSAGIRWSTGSRELMFVDQRQEGDNIWCQPVNGDAARQLTHLRGYTLFGFDRSRTGNDLVLSRGIQARDVVLMETAPPEIKEIRRPD